MSHVFISYSHKDICFVQTLVSSLRRRGFAYWFDIEGIKPGDVWDDTIHHALTEAERLLVVVSPESMESPEVGAEWRYAIYLDKPVIPLYLHTVEKTEFPYRLTRYNYIDFRQTYQPAIDQLFAALQEPVPPARPPSSDPADYVEAAKDPNWYIRYYAVQRLIDIGAGMMAGAGVAALIATLSDERESVRNRADVALKDSPVQEAKEALRRLGGPETDADLRPFKTKGQAIGPEWVKIPAGYFIYGDDELYQRGLAAKHRRLYLDTFYIARYPVTNREYLAFMEVTHRRWEDWEGRDWISRGEVRDKPRHPAVCVSWHDALAYCEWLSTQLGYAITLPTEEQWEKAARGSDGRAYPWGNAFDWGRCNAWEGPYLVNPTTPVDAYPGGASPYGVMDMVGNVLEWCLNEYDNPANADTGGGMPKRVARTGYWLKPVDVPHPSAGRIVPARAAVRDLRLPTYRFSSRGFRVVCGRPPSR